MILYMLIVDKCFDSYAIDESVFISRSKEVIESKKQQFIDEWGEECRRDIERYRQILNSDQGVGPITWDEDWYIRRIATLEHMLDEGFEDRFTIDAKDLGENDIHEVITSSYYE